MRNIAVPELRRYAPDALRMVGIPLGQADETADMLTWTEAVEGGGLRFLQLNRARLLWIPRARARVVAETEDEAVVDCRGGSLLEFGIRITDFICGEVRRHGRRRVRVLQIYGSLFLGYLTAYAAQRGVSLTATWAEDAASRVDPAVEPDRELVLTGEPISDGERPADVLQAAKYLVAVERGIDLSDEDFETVTRLFEMLRVPTSERSRSHAG